MSTLAILGVIFAVCWLGFAASALVQALERIAVALELRHLRDVEMDVELSRLAPDVREPWQEDES